MTWGKEGRDLPANWHSLVRQIKQRAKASSPAGVEQCEARLPRSGRRCPRVGTDVDHTGHKDDHRLDKLRLICPDHHKPKTSAQGHAAWAAKKAKAKRPDEVHPGRLLG